MHNWKRIKKHLMPPKKTLPLQELLLIKLLQQLQRLLSRVQKLINPQQKKFRIRDKLPLYRCKLLRLVILQLRFQPATKKSLMQHLPRKALPLQQLLIIISRQQRHRLSPRIQTKFLMPRNQVKHLQMETQPLRTLGHELPIRILMEIQKQWYRHHQQPSFRRKHISNVRISIHNLSINIHIHLETLLQCQCQCIHNLQLCRPNSNTGIPIQISKCRCNNNC
mmetsp:Transcript_9881/g.14857  ORF Transcript_9881/g.14857 Transcript_9881/m.14857 type:complete len:222 (-) Transcript_9881:748-1413(-)